MIEFFEISLHILSQLVMIFVITFVITLISNKLLKHLRTKFEKTESIWDEVLIDSIMTPVNVLIWVFGITIALDLINNNLHLGYDKFIKPIRPLAVVFCLAWSTFGFIHAIETHWSTSSNNKNSKLDKTTAGAIAKILRISALIITIMMIMETLGFSISGVLAFAGGGGVAIGFASKDLVANFFGALMIYLDKPFKVGDWIRIPEKNIEGFVDRIALRCTVIQTLDKRPMYVPNSVFTSVSIENASRMSHRKLSESISLNHQDLHCLDAISKGILKILHAHEDIDSSQTTIVSVSAFTPVSIDIMFSAFTTKVKAEDFYRVKHNIMLKVAKVIEKSEARLTQGIFSNIPNQTNTLNKDKKA